MVNMKLCRDHRYTQGRTDYWGVITPLGQRFWLFDGLGLRDALR